MFFVHDKFKYWREKFVEIVNILKVMTVEGDGGTFTAVSGLDIEEKIIKFSQNFSSFKFLWIPK